MSDTGNWTRIRSPILVLTGPDVGWSRPTRYHSLRHTTTTSSSSGCCCLNCSIIIEDCWCWYTIIKSLSKINDLISMFNYRRLLSESSMNLTLLQMWSYMYYDRIIVSSIRLCQTLQSALCMPTIYRYYISNNSKHLVEASLLYWHLPFCICYCHCAIGFRSCVVWW